MPAPECPRQRTTIAKGDDEDNDHIAVKMSDAKAETKNDNNIGESIKEDVQDDKLPVSKAKRAATKRLTTLEKTAQEGNALLKGLDTSIGEVEGRRRTRSAARGVVTTPAPSPPKKEKRDTTRSSGGRGRGRPKKNDHDEEANNKVEKEKNSKMDIDDADEKDSKFDGDEQEEKNNDGLEQEVTSKNKNSDKSENSDDKKDVENEQNDDPKSKKVESCKNSTKNDISEAPSSKLESSTAIDAAAQENKE